VSLWTLSKEVGVYIGTMKTRLDRAGAKTGIRLREDRSEVLKLRSEKRHKPVARQNGLMDNWH
jgi:hypothetical protein